MSFGLLFSGQGPQHAAMLSWVDEHDPLLACMQAVLGTDGWRQALADPAWGAANRHAQVLLTGVALAAWSQLAPRLPAPAMVAGYSVGELAAFCAAGVFDAETAIGLAAQRALAMDRAAGAAPGGLLAVTGVAAAVVDAICRDAGAAVAIRIDVDAAVIGGSESALAAVAVQAAAHGARCSRLNVAVASHTPAMQPAADAVARVLDRMGLRAPALPLVAGATADRVHDVRQAARVLALQVAQTVLWDGCMDAVADRRPACVLEVGSGSALAAMWNRRHPHVPARSADEFRSVDAVAGWVLRRLGC